MRYFIAIVLLFICSPGFAKHRHKHHTQHRYSGHHQHSGRNRKAVVHKAAPRIITEDDILSEQFEAHKGNLLFPVETANPLISRFNKFSLDEVSGGVNISCRAGSCVRTVHEGTVSSVFSVDNDDKMVVIVKHGNYFTVYNSVANTAVKKGEKVKANQEIGTIAANDDGEPKLNFQIWKAAPGKVEKTKLDPEAWIIKSY